MSVAYTDYAVNPYLPGAGIHSAADVVDYVKAAVNLAVSAGVLTVYNTPVDDGAGNYTVLLHWFGEAYVQIRVTNSGSNPSKLNVAAGPIIDGSFYASMTTGDQNAYWWTSSGSTAYSVTSSLWIVNGGDHFCLSFGRLTGASTSTSRQYTFLMGTKVKSSLDGTVYPAVNTVTATSNNPGQNLTGVKLIAGGQAVSISMFDNYNADDDSTGKYNVTAQSMLLFPRLIWKGDNSGPAIGVPTINGKTPYRMTKQVATYAEFTVGGSLYICISQIAIQSV